MYHGRVCYELQAVVSVFPTKNIALAVQSWSVFLLRKYWFPFSSSGVVSVSPTKHWLPFGWWSVLPYRKHCFPFECFSFAFRSAVQDGAVFPLTLRKALLSIRVFSYETLLSIRLFRTGGQCFSLRKTAFRWLFKVALDMFSQHSINKECLHSPDKMLLVLQVLLMSCL